MGDDMARDALERVAFEEGPTMVGSFAGEVAFGFTERTGGVSAAPFASLNLGSHVGDDPAAVEENRMRVLRALGEAPRADRLLVPNQVHGDDVVVVGDASAAGVGRVRSRIAEGADAVACTVPGVPVMLCFADCVPVVIVGPGGFAVAHSGWRGTFAGIAGKAARVLASELGCPASELSCCIGPHILGDEYEVSEELMDRFRSRFASLSGAAGRMLDLSAAIRESLEAAGVRPGRILDTGLSTMRDNDRFFSFRKEGGTTGRHAAVAVLRA